jgi:hypothetical protein
VGRVSFPASPYNWSKLSLLCKAASAPRHFYLAQRAGSNARIENAHPSAPVRARGAIARRAKAPYTDRVSFGSAGSLEFAMTRIFALVRGLALGALLSGAAASQAQISIKPEALTHYSYCISAAKDRNAVFLLDRGTMYRCGDDIAVSYFNYLGRQKAPEKRVVEAEGVFIYRMIAGVGKCWNKIEDAYGNPTSTYGCDIYIEL